MSTSQIQYSDLVGDWQLVYFEGIDKVKSSPQYLESSPEFRSNVEAKIAFRLENTVYKFKAGDVLEYTDFEKQNIVLKKAKIQLAEGNVIHILQGDEVRKAEVLELNDDRLVLKPISEKDGAGKLVFAKIREKKK
ncbi:lipocalin-like domain-containing protein [Algoriphagus namhaensis]